MGEGVRSTEKKTFFKKLGVACEDFMVVDEETVERRHLK